jgi:hypothetical protein
MNRWDIILRGQYHTCVRLFNGIARELFLGFRPLELLELLERVAKRLLVV